MALYGVPAQLVCPRDELVFNDFLSNPYLHLTKFTGVDFPGVRNEKVHRPWRRGAQILGGFADAIYPTIEGVIVADDKREVEEQMRRIRAACRSIYTQPGTLVWSPVGAQPRQCTVFVNEKPDFGEEDGLITFMIPLVSEDAAAVSTVEKSVVTTLVTPGGGGGLTFPWRMPFMFADPSGDGSVTISYEGDLEAFPVVRIWGEITNPVLSQTTTGETLFLIKSGLTIPTGQYVEVDMLNETVRMNGLEDEPLLGALDNETSRFWFLEPETDNGIRLSGDAPSGAYAEVTWRDTYS